jgi:hypothetical protein
VVDHERGDRPDQDVLSGRGLALSVSGLLVALWALAGTAVGATPPVGCNPLVGDCTVSAGGGGTTPAPAPSGSGGTGGGGGGGVQMCTFQGAQYMCYSPYLGWFDTQNGCYYLLVSPQPPASDPSWHGHKPDDGAVYSESCPLLTGAGLPGGTLRWLAGPPPGFGGAIDVAALAQQAVKNMALVGPTIGIAPKVGGKSLVGLPVWLWDNVSPTTWGPNTAQAAAGGVTVTATGSVTQIGWAMGDGASVTCTTPGVAYQQSFGAQMPACGHVYTVGSGKQPGGAYTITGTSTWVVNWNATTGQTGVITVTRQSQTTAIIGELQVLNNN